MGFWSRLRGRFPWNDSMGAAVDLAVSKEEQGPWGRRPPSET